MEFIGPILPVLKGSSPWLLLVATWIGGALFLIRTLVIKRRFVPIEDYNREVENARRWEGRWQQSQEVLMVALQGINRGAAATERAASLAEKAIAPPPAAGLAGE